MNGFMVQNRAGNHFHKWERLFKTLGSLSKHKSLQTHFKYLSLAWRCGRAKKHKGHCSLLKLRPFIDNKGKDNSYRWHKTSVEEKSVSNCAHIHIYRHYRQFVPLDLRLVPPDRAGGPESPCSTHLMGQRSELWDDHSKTWTLMSLSHFVTNMQFDQWLRTFVPICGQASTSCWCLCCSFLVKFTSVSCS